MESKPSRLGVQSEEGFGLWADWPGEGGRTGLWHLGWIQTTIPVPVGFTQATRSYTSNFTDAILSSPTAAALLQVRMQAAPPLCWIWVLHPTMGIGLGCLRSMCALLFFRNYCAIARWWRSCLRSLVWLLGLLGKPFILLYICKSGILFSFVFEILNIFGMFCKEMVPLFSSPWQWFLTNVLNGGGAWLLLFTFSVFLQVKLLAKGFVTRINLSCK